MLVLSREELTDAIRELGRDGYCADIAQITRELLHLLAPPENISTLEYSKKHRKFRGKNGVLTDWKEEKAPYAVPAMHDLDDPAVRSVVIVKPARVGGTVVAENYALKTMEYGPHVDIMWYLAGPGEVNSYAEGAFRDIFEIHAGVSAKITAPHGKQGNTKTIKKVGPAKVELMVMSKTTTTNRQAGLIVLDETDSYSRDFRSNSYDQAKQRQAQIEDGKIFAASHPDLGWTGGISQSWLQTTRGIAILQCVECGGHASPYPTKHWPDVQRFRLNYRKLPEGAAIGERQKVARETASMLCPHCGCALTEEQRLEMVKDIKFLHVGQTLDTYEGISGEIEDVTHKGYWWHALLSTLRIHSLPLLAEALDGAVSHYERTGDTKKLKQVLVRTFGEAYEGVGDTVDLDAQTLRKRSRGEEESAPTGYVMGTAPKGVRFITTAVDVGHNKFDVLLTGWDLKGRSWLIDRFTIRQRDHGDGILRDLNPAKVQEDWNVLFANVLDRLIPIQGKPGMALPVAVMAVDASDGNVTWRAYEFARRADKYRWGGWRRVRCIKGSTNSKAPQLPATALKISKDANGRPVLPEVTLHTLGVHSLKEAVIEALGIKDGSPGQCYFASNTPDKAYDEFFNEVLIDGKWHRNGPNETLDLYAYTAAMRLLLEPDREDRDWTPGEEPVWALPVSLEPKGGDLSAVAKVEAMPEPDEATEFDDIIAQFDALGSDG